MSGNRSALSCLTALLWNLLVAYVAMSICRIVFLLENFSTFSAHLSFGYTMKLLGAGLKFDTAALMYGNVVIIVLFLLPLLVKEKPLYYKVVRWIYVVINGLFAVMNLADATYFPLTGRRTTTAFFKEFSGEKGADFVNIFLNGIVQYWYLILVAAGLVFLLWKCFRTPSRMSEGSKAPYYIANSVSLPVSLVLCVFGMRGGTGVTTHPITLSNANVYVNHSIDAAIVLNTPFSIMRTIGDDVMEVPEYIKLSDDQALSYYNPVHYPASDAQFCRMNVLVIMLESFAKEDVGFDNILDDPVYDSYTPFLDSLSRHCLSFKWSYANGRRSIEAQPSVLSSIPNFVEAFLLTPAALNDLSGIAGELSRNKGYISTYYHGGNNGTIGLDSFAHSTGFRRYVGRNEYEASHGTGDFDGTWAIWDEEFLQFCCEDITTSGEPFASSIFTATSHHPFKYPERYGYLPQGCHPIQKVMAYTDLSLRRFFDSARKQSWFDNTIFVLVADHTAFLTHQDYLNDVGRYCVPLMIYAPSRPELCGRDCEKVVDQIDIMPTVLSIMGYDHPYVAFGDDILSLAPEDGYAIQYLPSSQIYQYIDNEYAVQFREGTLVAAFRYRDDVRLGENVLEQIPSEKKEFYINRIESIIKQYMSRMNNNCVVFREGE